MTKYIYFGKCSQVFCFMYVGFCSIYYCHVLMQNNGRFSWPKSISMKSVPFVSVSMDVCCWMILMFGFDVDTLNLDLLPAENTLLLLVKEVSNFFWNILRTNYTGNALNEMLNKHDFLNMFTFSYKLKFWRRCFK